MSDVPETTARYSGPKSKKFWKRINAIKDEQRQRAAYGLGCQLQELEGRVLRALDVMWRDDAQS